MEMGGVHAAIHCYQMVESFKSFRKLRTFLFGKQTIEFEGKRRSVDHFAFSFSWMDRNSVQGYIGVGRIESCRSDFPVIASIDRIGIFGPEFFRVEVFGPSSDFFVGGKKNRNRVMRNFGVIVEKVKNRHDRGDAGFVIGPKQRRSVRHD